MTFLEKAKLKFPKMEEDKITDECPQDFNFEKESICPKGGCIECWNREMPDTDTKEKVYKLIDKSEIYDEGYNKGLNDAWELLRKLSGLKSDEFLKIYDTCILYEVIYKNTPQEALAKLKAYEEAQEIKVGDVVQSKNYKIVVTKVSADNDVVYGFDNGGNDFCYHANDVTKTGKHIDIKSILESIGE
jgi:hypothetical protein